MEQPLQLARCAKKGTGKRGLVATDAGAQHSPPGAVQVAAGDTQAVQLPWTSGWEANRRSDMTWGQTTSFTSSSTTQEEETSQCLFFTCTSGKVLTVFHSTLGTQ